MSVSLLCWLIVHMCWNVLSFLHLDVWQMFCGALDKKYCFFSIPLQHCLNKKQKRKGKKKNEKKHPSSFKTVFGSKGGWCLLSGLDPSMEALLAALLSTADRALSITEGKESPLYVIRYPSSSVFICLHLTSSVSICLYLSTFVFIHLSSYLSTSVFICLHPSSIFIRLHLLSSVVLSTTKGRESIWNCCFYIIFQVSYCRDLGTVRAVETRRSVLGLQVGWRLQLGAQKIVWKFHKKMFFSSKKKCPRCLYWVLELEPCYCQSTIFL